MIEKVLVTGAAGFIGFHLCQLLLEEGIGVVGVDVMSDYYDVTLKRSRQNILCSNQGYRAEEFDILDMDRLGALVDEIRPDAIVHLAAQAGVRYSLQCPRTYVETNVVGTFNVMECARRTGVGHLLMASSSSVYGNNPDQPFFETHRTDEPLTIYAATKKSSEVMAHAYAHLWKIPTTMFRFFTVYGPWGRPDMALFKFTKGILEEKPIEIYNNGEMYRDFTYVGDLARAIRLLIDTPPSHSDPNLTDTAASQAAAGPFRIVNVGNSEPVKLTDFVDILEECLQKKAIRKYMDMQKGDVPATWADSSLLWRLTDYGPATNIRAGIDGFVSWYREYYRV